MRLFLESMINYTDIVIVYECILHNKWIFHKHKTPYHIITVTGDEQPLIAE